MQENSALSKYTEYFDPKIAQALRSNLPDADSNAHLAGSRDRLFEAEGAHIYALLVTLGTRVVGGEPEHILPAAAAMEYVAKAAKLFRNQADIPTALAMLNHSYGLMFANINISDERAIRAHHELVEFIGAGVLTDSDGDVEDDEDARASASSLLIRLSLRVGAILAGADHLQLEALSRFAVTFGRVFQLKENLTALTQGPNDGLTAELARNRLMQRLVGLIDEAKRLLDIHFPNDESALILAQLTEDLPNQP